jgi:hypothetical protein
MLRRITAASALLLLVTLIGAWRLRQGPTPIALTPSLTGETEYCQTCHAELPEISSSHPVDTFGCVICHGGERLALDADLAHSSMRGGSNPADLAVAQASCGGGDCHSGDPDDQRDHIQRVMTSVQATYAGAIAQIGYTFGAQQDLIARQGIFAIQDDRLTSATGVDSLTAFDPHISVNPSLLAFADNCLHCHLGAQPLDGPQYDRLTGCAACHTPDYQAYSDQPVHQLTTAIPYNQCNACHNRGNYDLGDMQFHARQDEAGDRLSDYYQPIAQFARCEWTLDCIDCHTRDEVMGDGDIHNSQAEIQYVQCRTCHGTLEELPLTYTIQDPDDIALRMAFLNPVVDLQVGDTIIVTQQGEPLWNVRQLPDGAFEQFGKATGQRFTFKPVMGTACQQDVNQQESRYCHECHAVER